MDQVFIADQSSQLRANVFAERVRADGERWLYATAALHKAGARFLSLWGADDRDRDGFYRLYAAYVLPGKVTVLESVVENKANPSYPSIASLFPAALRMQRAVYDLLGVSTEETDSRGWLRHSGWPEAVFPLRRDVDGSQHYDLTSQPYPFIPVEGDGVHEIAVGPIHAGTIEPGHFRFSVVGEKVLRLEERLGYTHKGVAKRFEAMSQKDGHLLAARLSGDSAIANSWAYCAALESIVRISCPSRSASLRALALEHERLANHLGDLGALGNDAGFAFGLTQFSRMKENLLRVNTTVFGARYLMDFIVPGGVASDLPTNARFVLLGLYQGLEDSVSKLRSIYDEHAGVQDRFREAGQLKPDLADRLGAIGLVGRASGIALDLRVDHPWPPYDRLSPRLVTKTSGDVAARAQLRFDEIFESLRLCRLLLESVPPGKARVDLPVAEANTLGIGLIEGWRGPAMIALETGPDGAIRRCHPHDPSWQNWPLLEYAILGNIVPDFPLINKSFNLSYSGHDG